jgi:hypothetical protein
VHKTNLTKTTETANLAEKRKIWFSRYLSRVPSEKAPPVPPKPSPPTSSILKRRFKGKGKEKEVRFVMPTPSPQSSHRSSPIPEVYNTPEDEQELSHLLEVLRLDDVTPEGDFEYRSSPIFTRVVYITAVFEQVISLDWLADHNTHSRRVLGMTYWTIGTIARALRSHNLAFLPPPPH